MSGFRPILAAAVGIALLGLSLEASSVVASPEPAGARAHLSAGIGLAPARTAKAGCPAPAVSGINMGASARPRGRAVTLFVVVQNLGDAAFHAPNGAARLVVRLDGREMRRFSIEDMAPGQVSFFRMEAAISKTEGAMAEDSGTVSARLEYAAGLPIGPVPGSLDCRIADNAATRRAG